MSPRTVAIAYILAVTLATAACQQPPPANREAQVRAAVEAFHRAFDDGFTQAADYATDDWYHVNPNGGVARGREATLTEVRGVHHTFLKGTTDAIRSIDVRFASDDVAVATVLSDMSPFTSPDGVHHEIEGHVRTFVVVRRGDQWRIMQDHNTTILAPPPPPAR